MIVQNTKHTRNIELFAQLTNNVLHLSSSLIFVNDVDTYSASLFAVL